MKQVDFLLRPVGCAALATALVLGATGELPAQHASLEGKTSRLKAVLRGELRAYLRERSAKEHLSALSLTVSLSSNEPPINVTAGTTKFHAGLAVTPTSLYQIGSNTKAFTAVAILQLEARHRLSIDAPIGDYLPQYPAYRRLTLRQILSMTGGLESYDNTTSWEKSFVANPMANMPADSLIRMVYPNVKFPPGTKYFYSNTGYLLAQEVVKARSESKNFDAEIARVIASVGLKHTFYTSHLFPAPIARHVVAGYYENDDAGFGKFLGQDMSGYSLSWAQGAGSIVSTPEDLEKWARALYEGSRLLPPKQKKELMTLISLKTAKLLSVPTAGDPAGFGLGVAQRFDPKLGTFWFYQGETLGFRAAHLYFPTSGIVVCLFANSRPTEANSQLQKLFGTVYASIQAAGLHPRAAGRP